LDYILENSDYNTFFTLFLSTYNGLSSEVCFPQRIGNITVLDDVGTGSKSDSRALQLNRPRGPSTCSTLRSCLAFRVRVECSAKMCPQGDALEVLFGLSSSDLSRGLRSQSLQRALGYDLEMTYWTPRNLNIFTNKDEGSADDVCICLWDVAAPDPPTFTQPELDDFLETFNEELAGLGLGQVISIGSGSEGDITEPPTSSPVADITTRPITQGPTSFPSGGPTNFCTANTFSCAVEPTAVFDTYVKIETNGPVTDEIAQALLETFPVAYDQLAGTVCDSCRRYIIDIELLSSGVQIGSGRRQLESLDPSIRGLQRIQETTGERSVIFKLLMGQAGGCDAAFDNNSDVVSNKDMDDFVSTCDVFAPFDEIRNSGTCCCALCRDGPSNPQQMGLSRHDFGQWFVESLQVKFGDIIEAVIPQDRKRLEVFELVPRRDDDEANADASCREGESESRRPSIFLGLDYRLDQEKYDEFLSIFNGAYNRKSLEACFPQRARNNAVVGDFGAGGDSDTPEPSRPPSGGGVRGPASCSSKTSCLVLEVAVECSARVCPQGDSLEVLFGESVPRRLNELVFLEGSNASPVWNRPIVSSLHSNKRQLQLSESVKDECFCLAIDEDGGKEPTFKPVAIDDFINEFNNDLGEYGFGPIASIDSADDFVERDVEEDDGPSIVLWIVLAACSASLIALACVFLLVFRRRSIGNAPPADDPDSENKAPQQPEDPAETS